MYDTKPSIWSRNFILITTATLLMATSFYFLISTLPLYVTEVIKVDKSLTGFILASFTISALFIRPFTGFAIDGWGRKWIYIIAFFVMSVLFNMYLFAITVSVMLTLRFLHGFAWGVTSTVGATIVVDILPISKRGQGLGIFGLSMPFAMALGPMIGLTIIKHFDYTVLFIIGSIFSLAGFGLLLFMKFPKYHCPPEKKKLNFRNLFEMKSVPMALNVLFVTLPYGGIISFIAVYAKEIGIQNAGIFFLVFAGGIAVSRLFSGKIFDIYGPKIIFLSGIALLIIGFPILGLVHNIFGFLFASALLGIGNGVIFPVSQAMINNMVEIHERGAANSTLFTAFDLGIGSGMVITGFLADKISLANTYLAFTGICVLGFLFAVLFIFSHYERHKLVK